LNAKSLPGSLQHQPSAFRQFLYFWLTRKPSVYLFFETRRPRGNWDKRVYLSFIERGDYVLDIGANFGSHAILFSHLIGKTGKLLAFEPVPISFQALKETIRSRARFDNIHPFQRAMGNPASAHETAVVNVPGGDFGQASLRVQNAGSWEGQSDIEEYSVPITSVDADESVQGLERIDWSRNNRALWEGRATIGGRVSKATNNVVLTSNVVKQHLGLDLSEGQTRVEGIYEKGRRTPKG